MVTIEFLVHNKLSKAQFFEETFLLARTSMEVVLEMPFLFFNNINLQFGARELIWRTYTIAKAILIARQVKLINKHNFAKVSLDENSKTFKVYVTSLEILFGMIIYPS